MQRSHERSQTTKKHPARRSRETTFSWTACSPTNLKILHCELLKKPTDPPQVFSGVRPAFEDTQLSFIRNLDSWNLMKCLNSTPLFPSDTASTMVIISDATMPFSSSWIGMLYLSTHFQSSSFNKMQNQSTFNNSDHQEIKVQFSKRRTTCQTNERRSLWISKVNMKQRSEEVKHNILIKS